MANQHEDGPAFARSQNMAARMTEISFEIPAEEAAVIDGYCSAKGIKRTAVMRRLLKEWSEDLHHQSIMICRVAGSKPVLPGNDRDEES